MKVWAESFLQKQWYRLGLCHAFLIPFSWLFLLLSGLRRFAYKTGFLKSYKLPVPVIIVGNISVGGTGKTPLVIWLADQLQRKGYAPAIISRGYLGNTESVSPVFSGSDPAAVGDEPVLIARRGKWPVWVGRNRAAVGRTLLAAHPECNVIISDDGLQHYKLERDVEIVVVDGNRGFGNGLLLPAGPLRERRARPMKADAIVCNGAQVLPSSFLMQLKGNLFHNLLEPDLMADPDKFTDKKICAIAGIGNPNRFFQQLRAMGLQFEEKAYPDHHAFQPADLQSIAADVILMTEKDAVKCASFAEKHWWYLPVSAVVDESLISLVLNKLRN